MSEPVLRLAERGDGIAVLTFDDRSRPLNTLRQDLVDELEPILDRFERSPPRGLVFRSGKPDCFIAGADLSMLGRVETAAEAEALSRLSQGVQSRIEALPFPTVAAIDGTCLGGGLELALAFDRRIATDRPGTRLGLPEVQLGLLPGGGGTQRLPRLVGIVAALDLLLTGRQIDARRALALGLVDALVDGDALLDEAASLASVGGPRGRRSRPPLLSAAGLSHLLFGANGFGRRLLLARARREALGKTRGRYPAPERILEALDAGLARGFDAGLTVEARAFGALVVSAEARELINLFFATTALKQESGIEEEVEAREVRRVGVLGAGLMGTGIAYVTAARAGVPVLVKDRDSQALDAGFGRIDAALADRERRGRLSRDAREELRGLIEGVDSHDALARCEVVIEAVFEDLELKRALVAEVERVDPSIVFATNTSSLPIADIAAQAMHPENVVGMHYFSPVERMPLLEVVRSAATSPEAVATAVALGKRQGKTVIVVNDGPGFYTSRILAPFLNEAAWMLSEGVAIGAVDGALRDLGFPVGPFKLLDEIGLDVAAKVSGVLAGSFGDRLAPPPGLEALRAAGRLGRKGGLGLYLYRGPGGKGGNEEDSTVYDVLGVSPSVSRAARDEIVERCLLQMVNEAALCLGEGVLRSARDGDVGAIFGLGFPPYLGGPFRYVDAYGAEAVVERLERLAGRLGPRFRPAPALERLAADGGRFHPAVADSYEGLPAIG